ncbi:MAG: hypothetical protein EPO10_29695 [Reyranella sp.]|uniref:hypothetical protein n=1 Tax=Reyranella sp. TaxID=1929291 RepID=UPI0012268C3E|nr:hypothetical protein [Reyranella sp.]TAJ97170.1 MAG: hypothetical protein EPO41_04030 [Reyranella sp.]TBR21557.1 MAG: hypothetical protein EPO10_29695 [Reyranella sp.]
MNIQAKIVIGSSSLYFADKSFDAVRDHLFADTLGDASWMVWALLAGIIALILGGGYVAAHWCWSWLSYHIDRACEINGNKRS